MVLGFWPVAGFFGLDFLALYIAFRVNFRQGEACEELVLTPIQLLVRRVTPPRQGTSEWRFNPLWTRLDREEDEEFGLLRLSVTSRGRDPRHRPGPLAAGTGDFCRSIRPRARAGEARVLEPVPVS